MLILGQEAQYPLKWIDFDSYEYKQTSIGLEALDKP